MTRLPGPAAGRSDGLEERQKQEDSAARRNICPDTWFDAARSFGRRRGDVSVNVFSKSI